MAEFGYKIPESTPKRFKFGIELKELYRPWHLHPSIKDLLVLAKASIYNESGLKYCVSDILGNGQASLTERCILKEKLLNGTIMQTTSVLPGIPLYVIRYFLGLLPSPLFVPQRDELYWQNLSAQCRNQFVTESIPTPLFVKNLGSILAKTLPSRNLTFLFEFMEVLRIIASKTTEPIDIQEDALLLLIEYFVPSLFLRPFRPELTTYTDTKFFSLLGYIIYFWPDILIQIKENKIEEIIRSNKTISLQHTAAKTMPTFEKNNTNNTLDIQLFYDDADIALVIEEVQKYPQIWNLETEAYHHHPENREAWNNVCWALCKEFGERNDQEQTEICNSMIKTWRDFKKDQFKYMNKVSAPKPADDTGKRSIFEQFPIPQAASATTGTRLSLHNFEQENPKQANKQQKTTLTQSTESVELPTSPRYNQNPRKRKHNAESSVSTVVDVLEPNVDRSFFENLLPFVNNFSVDQKLVFQSEVINLIRRLRASHEPHKPSGSNVLYRLHSTQRPDTINEAHTSYRPDTIIETHTSYRPISPQRPHTLQGPRTLQGPFLVEKPQSPPVSSTPYLPITLYEPQSLQEPRAPYGLQEIFKPQTSNGPPATYGSQPLFTNNVSHTPKEHLTPYNLHTFQRPYISQEPNAAEKPHTSSGPFTSQIFNASYSPITTYTPRSPQNRPLRLPNEVHLKVSTSNNNFQTLPQQTSEQFPHLQIFPHSNEDSEAGKSIYSLSTDTSTDSTIEDSNSCHENDSN